jgi:hypothetical protein
MGENLSGSIVKYIREIDIVILGIGIVLFVSGEHSDFSHRLYDSKSPIWTDLALFVSVYVFLTYDWIAYNKFLVDHPYMITRLGLGRVYIDLCQLFIKALLVYLSTLEITIWHLLLAGLLFLIWHPLIVLWHACASLERQRRPPMQWHHVLSIAPYAAYTALLCLFVQKNGWNVGDGWRIVWLSALCVLIVGISIMRQHSIVHATEAAPHRHGNHD